MSRTDDVSRSRSIARFIRSALEEHGYEGAVVGISGGIDSAVVAALTALAAGRERVLGVLLPEMDSAPETLRDSLTVCDHLGIGRIVKPITPILRAMGAYRLQPRHGFIPRRLQERYVRKKLAAVGPDSALIRDLEGRGDAEFLRALAYYRVKHRIRMACLYLEAEKRNYAVVGTTNRTEALTAFYVKWGDEAADLDPVRHLYKTQVYEMARELGLPQAILEKPPSPDLIPGVTDEMILGMPYPDLDRILMRLEQGEDTAQFEPAKVERARAILAAAPRRAIRNLSPETTA